METLKVLPQHLSIKTKIWGPTAWFLLHSAAMAYPKYINENNKDDLEIKNSMKQFLYNFGNVLPCPICGESYNKYIQEPLYNIDKVLIGRNELFYWTYILHERVNDKLGVPLCDRLDFKQVVDKYYSFIAKDGCYATTELQKTKNRKKGCTDYDFSEHKCIINIEEKDNKINKEINKEINKINKKNNIICYKNIIILILIIIIIILFLKLNNFRFLNYFHF